MWLKIKPNLTKIVMWSVKKHWLILVVLIGGQYLTGKGLADPSLTSISYDRLFGLHSFGGNLILIAAIFLGLEKIYLWLMRTGKI